MDEAGEPDGGFVLEDPRIEIGSVPMAPGTLRLTALGGLGQVGMNCLVLEQGEDMVLVDCGVTFPHDDRGIDVIHPRFDYVLEHRDRLRGVVITHGHEDHIGAVPYLLNEVEAPVYGPAYALALIRARLEEHGFDPEEVELCQVRAGDPFDVGSFTFEPIRVTHSIADATALAIRTAAGLVLHTGDFKLDPRPMDGELTDVARLRALGDEGIRLLMSDSTNIDSPGTSRSESDVAGALQDVIASAPARVFVGLFASNVQRLISLGQIAERTRRKLVLLGRSVNNHARVGREVSRLDWPSDLVVAPEVAAEMPPEQVLVLATGTQAEQRAALGRLAAQRHPQMKVERGDMVLMSSRIIPGNDRAVYQMLDSLLRIGAEVVTRVAHPGIHASGHAHREEQQRMLELTRPRAFMPVHGTIHHLTRHAGLGREMGVEEIVVAENGEMVEIAVDAPPKKLDLVTVGSVAIQAGEELSEAVLRERGSIGRAGLLSISVVTDSGGSLAAPPEVASTGVLDEVDADVRRDVEKAAAKAVEQAQRSGRRRTVDLPEAVRVATRRVVHGALGFKPTVHVLHTELGRAPR